MRRSARQVLATTAVAALLVLAAASPASVRANGFAPQADTWVATTGTPTGTNAGTSCSAPGFVVDGVNDEVEIGYAILDVLPGGTVHLCAGVYHVATGQGYTKSFTLAGAGRDATVIVGTATFDPADEYLSGGSEFLFGVGDDVLSVRDLTIRRFYGSDYGALYGEDMILDRVRMDHNGNVDGDGGAIWGADITVRDSIINDNFSNESGAAISASSVTVQRSIFRGNHAVEFGGAISVGGGASGVNLVQKSDFIDNLAGDDGGAILADNAGTLLVDHSRFKKNHAVSDGGAIAGWGTTNIRVIYSSFTANTTVNWGGAIMSGIGSLTIVSSRFYLNLATNGGGAIAASGPLQIQRSIFDRNQSHSGGALVVIGSDSTTVERSIFTANRAAAEGGGGAIYIAAPNTLKVRGNTFSKNVATRGAAILLEDCGPLGASRRAAILARNRFVGVAGNTGSWKVFRLSSCPV